jgi:hypothetical protein
MNYIINKVGKDCSSVIADYLCDKQSSKAKFDAVITQFRDHLPRCCNCGMMLCNIGQCYLYLIIVMLYGRKFYLCRDCYGEADDRGYETVSFGSHDLLVRINPIGHCLRAIENIIKQRGAAQ